MSTYRRVSVLCFLTALLVSPPVLAETCKPDVTWSHAHPAEKSNIVTDDIKGSRATRIEVCRDKVDAGAQLQVTVQFEGQRQATALAQGACFDRRSKWALLRSTGARNADGSPAEATGVYRICRE